MNLALLKSEILSRWTKESHPDYNQIAQWFNAVRGEYFVGGQDIPPVDLQLLLAKRGLNETIKAAVTNGKTPGAKEYAAAAVNITQMANLQASDLRKVNADALIAGLVTGEVITPGDETELRKLQTKPISFAQFTWGEDVNPNDVVRAMGWW
jgi:hypothetical protein